VKDRSTDIIVIIIIITSSGRTMDIIIEIITPIISLITTLVRLRLTIIAMKAGNIRENRRWLQQQMQYPSMPRMTVSSHRSLERLSLEKAVAEIGI